MLIYTKILLFAFLKFTSHDNNLVSNLTKHSYFKYINLNLEQCQKFKKCTLFSCSNIKYKNGFIDLSTLQESRTSCNNGQAVWTKIYNCTNNIALTRLICGIHYSINTHISYNYYNLIYFCISNKLKYKKRKDYFQDFIILISFVRISLLKILNSTNFSNDLSINKTLECINKMIKEIGCLDCDKCKVLGTLQFEGLKACIMESANLEINLNQKVYLILFYMKLLRTLKYVYYLENL